MSKIFDGIIHRVARIVGTNGNALFYQLVYRELFKLVHETCDGDEAAAIVAVRRILSEGAGESADRHPGLFRFFPRTPAKALKYINVLWRIFFGLKIGEYDHVQDTDAAGRERHVFTVYNCPFCGGYGTADEDALEFSHAPADKGKEAYGCAIAGMIQRVSNSHILAGTGYLLHIQETKCMLRGDPHMEIVATVYAGGEFPESGAGVANQRGAGSPRPERGISLDFNLDVLAELVNDPLEVLRSRLGTTIERVAKMPPRDLFALFENYEDDLVRILGFLPVHLLNEYGNLVEKILANELLAKTVGHVFRRVHADLKFFLPPEYARDNLELFLALVEDHAPASMLAHYRTYSDFRYVELLLEGARKALQDLGVQFTTLKDNVWEELRASSPPDAGGARRGAQERTSPGELAPYLEIVAEVTDLLLALVALPGKMLLAMQHAHVKTVATARQEVLDAVSDHVENLLDLFKDLQD